MRAERFGAMCNKFFLLAVLNLTLAVLALDSVLLASLFENGEGLLSRAI